MAVAYDNVCPDTFSTAGVGTLTSGAWTIAGSDRLAIGVMASATGGTRQAHLEMRWRGSTGDLLTQIGTSLDIGPGGRMSMWRRIAPSAESNTAYGLLNAGQDEYAIGMLSYTGADQTTPVGTSVTNTGTCDGSGNGTATVNVTTTTGQMVVAAAWVVNASSATNPTMTPAGGSTGRYEIEGAQLGWEALQVIELVASSTTTTMSIDIASANASAPWGIMAFVVNSSTPESTALMGQACL